MPMPPCLPPPDLPPTGLPPTDLPPTRLQPTGINPTDIHLRRAERRLDIAFEDGARFSLPAEYLRVESPSAEVQGHAPSQKQIVAGCRHVGILAVEPVGHYAIRILFDDRHDTGIFSWDYLHGLGRDQSRRWAAYLAALAAQGLSRDP